MKRQILCAGLLAASLAQASEIAVNQVGYPPGAAKLAAVPAVEAPGFAVVDVDTGRIVLRGKLAAATHWAPAGQDVRLADFSALKAPGRYRLRVEGLADSPSFVVAADAYAAVNAAAIKAFYFNRASTPLLAQHAGRWARPAGHPDDKVLVHGSAASASRPEGTVISSPKGWYDAGDYNKYIVNSGISVYTLLAAWEQFPALFKAQNLNIPESSEKAESQGNLPDLLDEVLWNLEWMLTMQDPADGGVYHKLTNKSFDGNQMPHETKGERYVVAKGTAAALDFAAVMAHASRVFEPFEAQRPGLSARLREASVAAWKLGPAPTREVAFKNPPDVRTGEYGDAKLDDEFAWAAAELYLTTGEVGYREALKLGAQPIRVPGWGDVVGLAWASLAQNRDKLTKAEAELVAKRVRGFGDELAATWKASAYRLTMASPSDFVWGSNAHALNQALMLIQAYRLSNDRNQLDAAQSVMDYVLGRNPLGHELRDRLRPALAAAPAPPAVRGRRRRAACARLHRRRPQPGPAGPEKLPGLSVKAAGAFLP